MSNNVGAFSAVVWPTYRQHENAAKRDRPKHYPGAPIRIHYMRKNDYAKVYTTTYASAFRDADKMTAAEYVTRFLELNGLKGDK